MASGLPPNLASVELEFVGAAEMACELLNQSINIV